jgi:Fe(3+) dicitrate transport protein
MPRIYSPMGFAFLLLLFVFPSESRAASLTGQVVDANSAAVNGATVSLRRQSVTFEINTTTNQEGKFHFDNLADGSYQLTVEETGFSAYQGTVTVNGPESKSITITLQPATVAESVVITSSHLTVDSDSLKRIPGSIELIDGPTLENSRPYTSLEALRKISGLNLRDEEGFGLRPNIGIRGLNPTRSTKVLLLEDGIPLTYAPYGDNASYYHPPIDRFETIEVLKGSGQILYGPQTVGGVINYVTRTPPASWTGYLTLTGGSNSYFNGHANYGGTVGNTGLLFEYTRKQGEGSRENIRTGLNDFNFKSVTNFNTNHAITTRFNYYGEDSNITYSGLRENEFRTNPRQNPFRNDFFYGDRFGASVTHAFIINPDVVLTTNVYGSYFKRHWWRQSSNSNERPNDSADPQCGGMANLNTTCGNQGRLRRYILAGVEPRLRVNKQLFGVRNELDLGFRAHAEDQERRQENGDRPTSRSGITVENNERRNQAYSGFVQNRFIFGDWTITPGVRVEHVLYQRTNRLLNVKGNTKVTEVIPGLGVSYSPAAKLNLFAGIHRGFAPPRTEDIINNTTGGVVDLDPELSWNYEAGVRTRFSPALRLDATFFRMDYENQIVPASLAGGIGSVFTNGGQTLHQGIEFVGALDTAPVLRRRYNIYLRGAYTFLPIVEFRGVRFSTITPTISVSGNRLPYAPEHLLTASAGYAHTSGLDAFVEAVYVGSQFADDLNSINPINASGQTGLIPSYTIWNATINYNVEKWRTTFFVTTKNLFDRLYIADRARGILPGPQRGVHAGLKFRF